MQQELMTINTEIAAVHEAQQALTTLMEGISTRLEAVPELEPSPEEFGDSDADRLSQAWDFTGSGVPLRPMERLATILEVAKTEVGQTPMMSTFAPPVSLPEIRPQGPPSFGAPSSSPALGWPMGMPKAPVSTQSGVDNAAFKEYVEKTISMMRAPPYEPPVEQSRTATPSIPI